MPGDEPDRLGRYPHRGHVVATRHVHVEVTLALLEEPVEVVAALPALALVPGEKRHLGDVFQDAIARRGDLLARRAPTAQRVRKFVAAKGKNVVVEIVVFAVARLIERHAESLAVEEVPGLLVLHRGHHLELGAAAAAPGAEDGEDLLHLPVLCVGVSLALVLLLLGEEHEGSPLVLHVAKHLPASAHDVPDAIHRHHEDGEVVPAHGVVDVHGAGALGEDVADVVLGACTRGVRAGDLDLRALHPRVALHVDDLEFGAGDSGDFAFGVSTFAEDERGVLVGDFEDVGVGIAFAFVVPCVVRGWILRELVVGD